MMAHFQEGDALSRLQIKAFYSQEEKGQNGHFRQHDKNPNYFAVLQNSPHLQVIGAPVLVAQGPQVHHLLSAEVHHSDGVALL